MGQLFSVAGQSGRRVEQRPVRLLLQLLLLPCLALACLSFSDWPLLRVAEQGLGDARLALANWRHPERISMDPRVVVVGMEPASFKTISKHRVFWVDLYTRCISLALGHGARGVALDIIPQYVSDEQVPGWVEMSSRFPGRLVSIAYWDGSGPVSLPEDRLIMGLGRENLALANISLDEDGVARRQAVQPLLTTPTLGQSAWPFLAPALAARAGVRAPASADGFIWTNFTRQEPRRIAFHDVLQAKPEELEAVFRNSLVLVGTRTKEDQDVVITPNYAWRGGDSVTRSGFGVDYQAQILNTLLQARGLQPRRDLALALLCVLLALTWLAAAQESLTLSFLGLLATCVVYTWLSLKAFELRDWVLPLLPGLLGLPLGWGVATASRAWRESRQRRWIHQTIAGYVAPAILNEMLADPTQWVRSLNQRRDVTVLFSDINDFSGVSERESPERVAEWLNEHYREMAHVIFDHQGTVIRFVGDQFMVLFGSPKSLPQPELAAVRTALAMHARLAELAASGRPGFHQVKIGIHCGSLLLAVIGDDIKRDYTAIGDEANLAARIQDLCKAVGQSTLVSQDIKDRIGDVAGLFWRDLGTHVVKGRRGEVHVFAPVQQR